MTAVCTQARLTERYFYESFRNRDALLSRLQREHGTAIVFVSHDLGVVHEIADTVAVVKDGRIVEAGPRDQIYHGAHQPYTRELLAASRLHSVDTIRAPRPLSGSTSAQLSVPA